MPPNLTTGPTTPVIDAFTRANGPMGPNWSFPAGQTADIGCAISANWAISQSQASSDYWNPVVYDFNAGAVESYMDVISGFNWNCQLIGYMYAVGYHHRFISDQDNNRIRLTRSQAGVETVLHNTDGVYVGNTGQMWMYIEPTPGNPNGLDIYCMYRQSHSGAWTQAFPVTTDTALLRTTGYLGIRLIPGASAHESAVDNFGGGSLSISNTVVTTPASVTMKSVAPSLRMDKTLISPPVIANAQSVAPLVSIPKTVVSVPAVLTGQSVAPSISGTALVVSPPAVFTSAAVSPLAILSPLVLPSAATWTATAASPGLGQQIISSVGVFTAATTAPGTGNAVAPNAATWAAAIATPVVVASVLPAAPVFTASSVAPTVIQGLFAFPNAMAFTAQGVSPSLSIVQVLTIPVAIWTATIATPLLVKTTFPNAALATFSAVAPALAAVLPTTVALATYLSSTPSFIAGSGQSLAVPPATFSASSGTISTSVYVVVPVAQFTPVGIVPVLINALISSAAVVSMASAIPLVTRSPLVSGSVSVVTMSASAPGILTGIGSTAAVFTAGATSPIPGNGQAMPPAMFTSVIPIVRFEIASLPSPIRATFTSAASVSVVVQLPVGVWTANASSPQLTVQVSAPAGKVTMPIMTLTMDIEKKIFADVARWTGGAVAPTPSIRLTSPVPIWIGSPQNPQIGRGTISVSIRTDFFGIGPNLIQESMQAIYTYQQGDIVESNAWSQWQH